MYQVAAHGYFYAKSSLQTHPEKVFFLARTQLELENVRRAPSGNWLANSAEREREIASPQGLSLTTHLFFEAGLRHWPQSQHEI